MRKWYGLIELLIGFLLLSIIVACFLKASIVQMEDKQIDDIRSKQIPHVETENTNDNKDIQNELTSKPKDKLEEKIEQFEKEIKEEEQSGLAPVPKQKIQFDDAVELH